VGKDDGNGLFIKGKVQETTMLLFMEISTQGIGSLKAHDV
jgi:hypothetical protein